MTDFPATLHPHHLLELLEQPGHSSFELDHFHTAIRFERHWALYRRQPNGWLRLIQQWAGTRRSIFSVLEGLGIEPSVTAEQELATLTETRFLEDEPEDEAPTEEPA